MKGLNVLSWVFSIFLLLTGFAFLFSAPVGGIFMILAGLILLPPLYAAIKRLLLEKFRFEVRTWQKSLAIGLSILISFIAIANTPAATANLAENASSGAQNTQTVSSSANAASSNITSQGTASSNTTASSGNAAAAAADKLTVSYIDVGQGDSELIQQGDQDMLIDAGTSDSQTALMNYIKPRIHGDLEYLVLTHPHEDHIGGASKVINAFNIDTVYMPNASTTTKVYQSVLSALQAKSQKYSQPVLGKSFSLGTADCSVFGPTGFDTKNLNSYSIVIKVTFGSTKFLFTGDAEEYNEKSMIANGYDLSADVLKVGHHGSDTSTCRDFLNAVSPKYAVIEVGKGNSYGHPTQTTLTRLHAANVTVYRTDLDGTIVATSDGKTITFDKQPSANEYVGAAKSSSAAGNSSAYKSGKSNSKSSASSKSSSNSSSKSSSKSASSTKDQSRVVYWTPNGKSYHYDRNCPTLSRSKTVLSGSLSEAIAAGKSDPCDKCVK